MFCAHIVLVADLVVLGAVLVLVVFGLLAGGSESCEEEKDSMIIF